MRNNIETFFKIMEERIPSELITHIIRNYIYYPINKKIIQKQKILKRILDKEMLKFFGILHYDRNFIVYRNNNGQVILENNYVLSNIHLFSHQENSNTLISSNQNTNEIVLFNNINNNQFLDENGIIRPRRIHLSIVYV